MKYLLCLLSFFLLMPFMVSAETQVGSGTITNPVWTSENSPYMITGTLEVAEGATLKIEAGSEVRFNVGSKLLINGELQILGTISDPVMMTLNTASSTSGLWGGIEFGADSVDAVIINDVYQEGSIIKGAIIKFSEGVKLNDASPYINNNQFSNNSAGISIYGTAGLAGGLVLNQSDLESNVNKTKPVYVLNNTLDDNSTGIIINCNNGQDYVLTPVGYSYIGDKIITSYITNNAITGSSVGIKILNGDNNIINNNVIRYNANSAITIAVSSRNNVIQNNNLNNNIFGAVIAGANTYITQNTVKNNSDTGLVITSKPLYFSYNNLYNNKKYNLNNTIYNLSAENNYWGDGNSVDIEAGLSMTIASSTYLVDYDSYAKEIISFDSLVDPVLKTVDRTTTASFVYFSGLKPVGVDVYLNSNLLDVSSDENSWAFNASLELGENGFYIYYKDADGNKSNRENISVQRYEILAAPTINSHEKKTTLESMILSGVKPVGSSLLLDGQEIKSVSNESTWSYNLDLEMGENIFSLTAYDSESEQTSLVTAININRTKDIIADTIAAEKAASVTPDVKLSARLAGRLLLQVENDGVIWYVNPTDNKRYLVTLDNALSLFRSLSLGITEENLAKLPIKDSGESGDSALMERLSGKLLLRVEKAGSISYIGYEGYRYDITRDNLMDIFRSLSLGISNENIYKISVGETE